MAFIRPHVITYPGFGEGKEARELYSDLEDEYGEYYNFHILPFYQERGIGGDRVVRSIGEHAVMLQNYMDKLKGPITLIGKCGGTRVLASLDDQHIARTNRIALVNMPHKGLTREQLQTMIQEKWKGGPLPDGTWHMPRSGNRSYVITDGYMDSVATPDMITNLNRIAKMTQLFLIRGTNDEMLRPFPVEAVPDATPIDIEGGDHHMMGESRQKMIAALALNGVLFKD